MKKIWSKILSLALVLSILTGYVPVNSFADEKIKISTQEELSQISDGEYILSEDITLDSSWIAIEEFNGKLDGNGKTITSNGESIFSYINEGGVVRNLIVKGRVSGNKTYEPIRLGGLAEVIYGKVQNSLIDIDLIIDSMYDSVGGVAGHLDRRGIIDNVVSIIRLQNNASEDDVDESKINAISGELEIGTIKNSFWNGVDEAAYTYDDDSIQSSEKVDISELNSDRVKDALNASQEEGYLAWGANKNGQLVPGGGSKEKTVREKLQNLVDEMREVDSSLYTTDTFNAFKSALDEAIVLLENSEASDDEINSKFSNLNNKFNELELLPINKEELREKVAQYESIDFSLSTKDSTVELKKSLQKAKDILENEVIFQKDINNAIKELDAKFNALVPRQISGVDITDSTDEVISITSADQLKNLQDEKIYRLDNDITIPAGWLNQKEMNAILDGNGHVIEITDNVFFPVFDKIGENGIVQNLGIKGGSRFNFEAGAIAGISKGLIVNSYSRANIESASSVAGGLVGVLDGGSIVNSYVSANVKAQRTFGALAGRSDYGLIKNSYWDNKIENPVSNIESTFVKESEAKDTSDLRTKSFIDKLNENRGELKSWGREKNIGLPYHGQDFEYDENVNNFAYPVKFTDILGNTVVLNKTGNINVNYILGGKDFRVGKLELVGYDLNDKNIQWTTTENHTEKILPGIESGIVYAHGSGTTTVQVYTVNENKEKQNKIAEFNLVGVVPTIEDAQVFVVDKSENPSLDNATNVAKQDFVIEGRQHKELAIKVKFEGNQNFVDVNEFNFAYRYDASAENQKKFKHNRNEFVFEEPFKTRFYATIENFETYVDIESTYVPITSIKPIGGTYEVHARNSMSVSFDFIPLTGAGTLVGEDTNQVVVVEPSNASYKNKWEITSADPSIANYVSYIIASIVPYKAGEVELTATALDPYASEPVTGKSIVKIVYKNPISRIDLSKSSYDIKEEEELALEMKLVGADSTEEHVSEPKIDWVYEGTGEVKIYTKRKYIDQGLNKPYVADDVYFVKAIGEGYVKATGTPIDRTNNVAPIVLEFNVSGNNETEDIDVRALAKKGLDGARNHFIKKFADKNFVFGDEWAIFSLSRSGITIDEEKKNVYVESVKEAFSTSNSSYGQNQKPTTIARTIIALGSIGADLTGITEYDFLANLLNSDKIEDGSNESIFALIAIDTNKYSDEGYKWNRDKLIEEILTYQNSETGGFGLNDSNTSSIDMTAMALQSLRSYIDRPNVKMAVDKAIKYLQDNLGADKSYSSSESISQTITALSSLGIDVLNTEKGFSRNSRKNIITSLMSYFDEDNSGFIHEKDLVIVNDISTVQALYALESYFRNENNKRALYDYSDVFENNKEDAYIESIVPVSNIRVTVGTSKLDVISKLATSTSIVDSLGRIHNVKLIWNVDGYNPDASGEYKVAARFELPVGIMQSSPAKTLLVEAKITSYIDSPSSGGSSGSISNTINIYFTLKGMKIGGDIESVWIPRQKVAIPQNSTVLVVFDKLLKQYNIDYINKGNYISSIKSPNEGQWLSEFTNGKNSGWMYTVNGVYVNKGLEQYRLSDNDEVIWHYTNDYTKKSNSVSLGEKSNAADATKNISQLNKGELFKDIAEDAIYKKAIYSLAEKGIVSGTGDGLFLPDKKVSRAEIVTMLFRYSGEDNNVANSRVFKDVKADAWYSNSIQWANSKKIVLGYKNMFRPQDSVTREELKLILERYNIFAKTSDDKKAFNQKDVGKIVDKLVVDKNKVTRAELAMILDSLLINVN